MDSIDDERKEYFHCRNMSKFLTTKLLPTSKFKDKMINNKGPTFG